MNSDINQDQDVINSKARLFEVWQQFAWCPYRLRVSTNTLEVQNASHTT